MRFFRVNSYLQLPVVSRSLIFLLRMQGLIQGIRSCQGMLKLVIQKHLKGESVEKKNILSRFRCVISSPTMPEKGLENLTVADVLMMKGDEKARTWISCHTNDTVYDAVKNMAQNNIGSLVVLKSGEERISGIITERAANLMVDTYVIVVHGGMDDQADYLRKIVAQGRSSKNTRVAEIMADENKLITVTSDTNILRAMQLMTDHHIRHVPVIDGKIVGMISIVDVVRAVVDQQSGELKRLNEFIRGEYY